MSIKIQKVDSDCYDVSFSGLNLGSIRKNGIGFWSNRQWTIDGEPPRRQIGGNGKTVKLAGYASKEAAAARLAEFGSNKLMEVTS